VTLTLTRPWSNLGIAHCLIILDICAKLFENPTRGSKDKERTRKCDGRTDSRRTDGGDIIRILNFLLCMKIFNFIFEYLLLQVVQLHCMGHLLFVIGLLSPKCLSLGSCSFFLKSVEMLFKVELSLQCRFLSWKFLLQNWTYSLIYLT